MGTVARLLMLVLSVMVEGLLIGVVRRLEGGTRLGALFFGAVDGNFGVVEVLVGGGWAYAGA